MLTHAYMLTYLHHHMNIRAIRLYICMSLLLYGSNAQTTYTHGNVIFVVQFGRGLGASWGCGLGRAARRVCLEVWLGGCLGWGTELEFDMRIELRGASCRSTVSCVAWFTVAIHVSGIRKYTTCKQGYIEIHTIWHVRLSKSQGRYTNVQDVGDPFEIDRINITHGRSKRNNMV